MTPCHPRCPNAPDPEAIYRCALCGEAITYGDKYYEMDAEFYHKECFETNAVQILIDECGAMRGVAKR